jgi:hypothetical protein
MRVDGPPSAVAPVAPLAPLDALDPLTPLDPLTLVGPLGPVAHATPPPAAAQASAIAAPIRVSCFGLGRKLVMLITVRS